MTPPKPPPEPSQDALRAMLYAVREMTSEPVVEPLRMLARYALLFAGLSDQWWPLGKVSLAVERQLYVVIAEESDRLQVPIQTRTTADGVLEIHAIDG